MIAAVTVIVTVGTGNEIYGDGRRMRCLRKVNVGQSGEGVWSLR